MARLNEPDPSAEPVDLLKRRFIRQNRDLTKSNATQAIRIRCLETEISRLLTDNLQLRQEVLHIQNQLDTAPSGGAIDHVRLGMIEKLGEMQALLVQLDGISRGEKVSREAGNRASLQFEQKRQDATTLEYNGSVERMPTIRENKSYPRRTMSMDAQEMQALVDANTESPDMGSPPVAHYDDAITPFQPSALQAAERSPDAFDTTEMAAALPDNLETRRKHRPFGDRSAVRRMEFSQSPEVKIEEGTQAQAPVRSSQGQKRKLEVREDAKSETLVSSDVEKDKTPVDFVFQTSTRRRSSTGIGRRALAHKNINPSPAATIKDTKPGGKPKDQEKPNRIGRTVVIVDPKQQAPAVATIQDSDTAPSETISSTLNNPPTPLPPTNDILSPLSTSAPSTTKRSSKDTPPPFSSTLTNDTTSRRAGRARAPVSYAEPSLNTKMRRPTKEMVDAVGPTTSTTGTSHRTSLGGIYSTRKPDDDFLVTGKEEAESPSRSRRKSHVAAPSRVKQEIIESEGIDKGVEGVEGQRPSRRITITRRQSLSAFDFVDSSPPLDASMTAVAAGAEKVERLERRRRSVQLRREGEVASRGIEI